MSSNTYLKEIAKKKLLKNKAQIVLTRLLSFVITVFSVSVSIIVFFELKLVNTQNLIGVAGISMLVIIGLCFISFYSIVSIWFMQEQKSYINMKIIGCSNKDIKKITKYEVNRLTTLPILLGGIFGFAIGGIVTSFSVIVESIIIALFTMVTIYSANRKSYSLCTKKINKLPLINTNIKKQKKFKKSSAVKRKFNKWTLYLKHILYYRAKTIQIVTILLLSGTILVFAFTLYNSIDISYYVSHYYGDSDYKMVLHDNKATGAFDIYSLQINSPLNDKLIKDILSIDGIKSVSTDNLVEMDYLDSKENRINDELVGINNLSAWTKSKEVLSLNEDTLITTNGIIVNENSTFKKYYQRRYSVGEVISVFLYDGNQQKQKDLTISAVISDETRGSGFFTTNKVIRNITENNTALTFRIYGAGSEDIKQQLGHLVKNQNIKLSSRTDYEKTIRLGFSYLEAGLNGILFLVLLFSFINVINILIVNITSRKKDFNLLHILGMDYTQIKKIIGFESIAYALISIIGAVLIGNYLCKAFCSKLAESGLAYFVYSHSYIGVILFFLMLIICKVIVMSYCNRILSIVKNNS